jgi:hypothetical protein
MGPDIPQDKKGGITMTLKEAITLFGYHQRSNVRAITVRSYQPFLQRFEVQFGERSFDSIGSDEIPILGDIYGKSFQIHKASSLCPTQGFVQLPHR